MSKLQSFPEAVPIVADARAVLWRTAAYGGGTLMAGWWLIKSILERSGRLNETLVFATTFAPLWLGAIIGAVVVRGAAGRLSRGRLTALAVALALPVALSDPWIIVALGFGPGTPLAPQLLFLVLPVLAAAGFAALGAPGRTTRPVTLFIGAVMLALVNLAMYISIYWWILPRHNLVGMPGM
jgi:hypothetical protein